MLSKKNVLIGITGGIAAYKILNLISLLTRKGCNVKTILTEHAEKFITRLSLQTISKNKVYTDMFATDDFSIDHISLAEWADIFIVAPATANIIGKFANGVADDLLSTVFLSIPENKKIFIAPAMNTIMLEHPAVKKNMDILSNYNNNINIIPAAEGMLACGDTGKGRLPEPEEIITYIESVLFLSDELVLKNKQVLITAGPTREYIDPVRFISNESSGLQGYALANACAAAGADVILVSGKICGKIDTVHRIKIIETATGAEMFEAVKKFFSGCDIFIGCAAVADYKPANYSTEKIKKIDGNISIEFSENPDILKWCGHNKEKRLIIGFAAETENIIENAKLKLQKKKCDMIVANNARNTIGKPDNKITIIFDDGQIIEYDAAPKNETAKFILNAILQKLNA